MDKRDLYTLALEVIIEASGNEPLTMLANMAKDYPQQVMDLAAVNVVDMRIRHMWAFSEQKHSYSSFIKCIKEYRAITGSDLKLAKEAVETILDVKQLSLQEVKE